jgi:hypothetical protein
VEVLLGLSGQRWKIVLPELQPGYHDPALLQGLSYLTLEWQF